MTPPEQPRTAQQPRTGISPAARPSDGPPSGPPTGSASAARPGGSAAPVRGPARPAPAASSGPRVVRLTVQRIDPWSAMKLSFLLSVGIGIGIVVAFALVWIVLDGMGIFDSVNEVLGDALGSQTGFDVMDYVGFGQTLSFATVIAVIDVVLLTALCTLGALLYNVATTLVGGLETRLTDE